MSKYIIAIVAGFAVAFAIAFGLSALQSAAGESMGFTAWFAPIFFGALTAYLMANLAGNRKVAKASQEEKARALAFQPPEGQGLLIVYREGFVGRAAGLNLALDGREFAQLKAPRFTALTVSPGDHDLTAGFGGLAGPQNRQNLSKVSFQPGDVLAVKASLSMGMVQNTIKLEGVPVDDTLRRKLQGMPMVAPE